MMRTRGGPRNLAPAEIASERLTASNQVSGGRTAAVILLVACLTLIAAGAGIRASSADNVREHKLIALTFDDGPKPYVLLGTRSGKGVPSQSLLDLLDRDQVKATFFVMGWRLSPNADDLCRKVDGGVCRDAAREEHRRGHEIENHTYGHGDFRLMEKRYGDAWILNDIERASVVIDGITGSRPRDLRPPDWDIWPALQAKIEAQGYHVMTRSRSVPAVLRDVDSEDYFCVGSDLSKCPKPSDYDYVVRNIEQRERAGVEQHILVFHELPQSVDLLARLIPELKQRGYTFVLLRRYLDTVKP
jgi:peptidoglycan/xylan/chitin deacetylase (PgdA/CDA1 family)